MNNQDKAAVFILLGQSNAVGHGIPMENKDKIRKPQKNVFGLKREYNQSFEISSLRWSGYTSGGMNLAEEQDHTYSLANCLADLWQKEIDSGNKNNLPDLYIVQIAIGAQGITDGYMWNPTYEKKLIPGVLGTVDISLYPFTVHILSLIGKSLNEQGKTPEIMGVHWRGGENDTTASAELLNNSLKKTYYALFDGFCDALGKKVPIVLHKMVSYDRCLDLDPSCESLEKLHYINGVFEQLSSENENISVFDVCDAPHYTSGIRGNGIFIEDAVHYTPQTNRWVAEQILNNYKITKLYCQKVVI